MAKAFFSRKVPFGLIPAEDNKDWCSFDSYAVDVPEAAVRAAAELRAVLENSEAMYMNMPAPEEGAQTEAEWMVAQLASITAGYGNG